MLPILARSSSLLRRQHKLGRYLWQEEVPAGP